MTDKTKYPRTEHVRKFVKDNAPRRPSPSDIQAFSMSILLDIHEELERINNNLEGKFKEDKADE